MTTDKPLPITKVMVWKAYQQVKRNGQAAGVDGQSLDDFNKGTSKNCLHQDGALKPGLTWQ
ncbi:hypothetical protein H8F24_12790 [Synechococcus sp. CBW1002]|uniref:hypothetical protein n=1 Tax=Synechococcus sp. CBW1002 TaxID=1353134 RepID=UPI0018CDD565|nr:hypothetical protein [Synechococcus sp. CBW1002]QPN58978.1 hypothetical protein H8F24_12790 [Synechococcus sp. CBW1002]